MGGCYCPACGGASEARGVIRAEGTVTECATCGFVVSDAHIKSEEWEYEPPSTILFADDSDLVRAAMQDALIARRLAESVLGARDGEEFLECFTWHLREGNPVEIAILDVDMPKLDGFATAVAMRAVERAFDRREPTPLLFFSARPCDANVRAVLAHVKSALFVNKMSSPDLGKLAKRVEEILFVLLRRRIAA